MREKLNTRTVSDIKEYARLPWPGSRQSHRSVVKYKQGSVQEKHWSMTCERWKAIQNLSLLNHRLHTEVMNTKPFWWRLFCWKQRTHTDQRFRKQIIWKTPIFWGSPCRREAEDDPSFGPETGVRCMSLHVDTWRGFLSTMQLEGQGLRRWKKDEEQDGHWQVLWHQEKRSKGLESVF